MRSVLVLVLVACVILVTFVVIERHRDKIFVIILVVIPLGDLYLNIAN